MRNNKLSPTASIIAASATILCLVVCYYGWKIERLLGHPNGSDTTIVIQQFYDTTIYVTKSRSTSKDTTIYYREYDTTLVTWNGMCDSVRRYSINDGNDSIEIYGKIHTLGVLLDRELSYRWKLPYQTIVTKTIYMEQKGLVIGADMLISKNISLGIEGGWLDKKGNYFHGNYFMDNTIIFGVSKIIDFRRMKANRIISKGI